MTSFWDAELDDTVGDRPGGVTAWEIVDMVDEAHAEGFDEGWQAARRDHSCPPVERLGWVGWLVVLTVGPIAGASLFWVALSLYVAGIIPRP